MPAAIQCDPGTNGCANPSANAPFFVSYPTEDIREYKYYRTRYGFTGNIDYKLGDVSGVYLRFLYSHFDNFGDRWVYTPSVGTFSTPTMSNPDGNMAFNAQIRRPVQVIGSLQAGGKHTMGQWLLLYEVAASRAATEDQGYSSADFGPLLLVVASARRCLDGHEGEHAEEREHEDDADPRREHRARMIMLEWFVRRHG